MQQILDFTGNSSVKLLNAAGMKSGELGSGKRIKWTDEGIEEKKL